MSGSAADLTQAITRLTSSNAAEQAAACAVLALKSNATGVDDALLATTVAKFVDLLGSSGNVTVQKNAAVALANAMEAHDSCWSEAVACSAGPALVGLMLPGKDAGLLTNVLTACAAFAGGGPAGAQQLSEANFAASWARMVQPLVAAIAAVPPATAAAAAAPPGAGTVAATGAGGETAESAASADEPDAGPEPLALLEASLDPLCKLATMPECRPALVQAGVIPLLASILASSLDAEVVVRTLLALGMLVGEGAGLQELASDESAMTALTGLMRQTDDEDCRQLAAGLFKALGSAAGTKGVLLRVLQQQQQGGPAT